MIPAIIQVATQEVQTRVGQIMLGTMGGSLVVGVTIETVNKYLQAGAFAVAILSGLCASFYYIRKGLQK